MEKYEIGEKYFNSQDTESKLNIWNDYCRETNNTDEKIYENDRFFFNDFFGGSVYAAVCSVCDGKYNYVDKYVKFDDRGNLRSGNYLSELVSQTIGFDEDFYEYVYNNYVGEGAEVEY